VDRETAGHEEKGRAGREAVGKETRGSMERREAVGQEERGSVRKEAAKRVTAG
jgi:hypothetical protein